MRQTKRYAPKKDLPSPAEIITNTIIAKLEEGVRPWRKPWTGTQAASPTRACGTQYRGINRFWLALIADINGYDSPYWMTYRQASELGGQVRKGERSTIAIFYRTYGKTTTDGYTGEETTETRRVLKSYPVFSANQIDGLPDRFHPRPAPLPTAGQDPARLAELQAIFDKVPATVRHGGNEAFYSPGGDYIQLPVPEVFDTYEHYCATRAHESIHWSGAPSRLNRDLSGRFGSDRYAIEEAIADLASAQVGVELGLPPEHLDDHASYIASWLRVLKADPRALLTIASKAEEAATYVLRLAGRTTDEDEEVEEPQEETTSRVAA